MVIRKSAILGLIILAGCSTTQQGHVPDAELVTVSRQAAESDCTSVGPVKGSTTTVKGTHEDAIEDLKKDAATRGANYVHLKGQSSIGTSAAGVAYICP